MKGFTLVCLFVVMITSVFPLLYSSFDGDVNDLDLGDEVEYTVTRKSAKLSAENIRKVPKGTVAPEVGASIVTKSNIGFKRNVLSIPNCDLGILILLVNVWFCHIYTYKAIWGNEIAMAFLLYFRTYCMIKEFFKEKWLGQWELWTPTKTSTQALFKLAEMVSRALAKLGDNFTVIFTYRNNLNYIGFFSVCSSNNTMILVSDPFVLFGSF